ncbi:MAG: carboxypeptidase regulatory-like domain-containing protein [Candidatus Binatia bacterium]
MTGQAAHASCRRRTPGSTAMAWMRLAGLLLALFPSASGADTGTVYGTVRFEGAVPTPPTIYMSADPACDKMFPKGRPAETLVVGPTGGLSNVIVHVKAGLPKDYRAVPASGSVKVDQVGCAYVPHVVGLRTGQELVVHNGDETYHNVNARAAVNMAFNDAMPAKGLLMRKSFPLPEVAVKLKCDVHPWMSAYVGVFDHPFFVVTLPDGAFEFADLPEGDYTIEAWHESLGTRTAVVEVDDDEPVTIDFRFAGN